MVCFEWVIVFGGGSGFFERSYSFEPRATNWGSMRKRTAIFCFATMLLFAQAATVITAEPKQLTFDGRLKRDPVFVRGGREIVFCGQHDRPRLVLRRLDLASSKITRLHPDASLPEFKPSYSRDEKVYAFLSMTGNDRVTLKLRHVEKKQTDSLKLAKNVAWHPAISPDGRIIVFNLAGQLYARPVADGRETPLAKSAGRNDWPCISPDGQRIAFGSSRHGNFEILVMNADGSNIFRLTESRGLDMRPSWSPDGKRIAFTSNRDGNYEIYVMHADGSRQRAVTRNDERDDFPSWHPNGRQLVYVGERDGSFDLYRVDVGR